MCICTIAARSVGPASCPLTTGSGHLNDPGEVETSIFAYGGVSNAPKVGEKP